MTLDPKFVLAPSLEMYFVDKDSGLPMANGQVFFYKDGTNILKDVYELSGVAPDYSFTVLPNPVTLSSVGTFQDGSGNNILPYYYPYDASGNVELYYIEVFNEDGVLQFTRSGWPNTQSTTAGNDVTNFVANGQFILHNNPGSTPLSGAQTETQINYGGTIGNQDVYQIAPGGWTFERNHNSTATDNVTFPRFGSSVTNPSGNPRYAVQIVTTAAGSDTTKDLALRFPNVNTFASGTQEYNLFFVGKASGSAVTGIQVIIRKYFGTGGNPSNAREIPVDTIDLTTSYEPKNVTLLFGTNETYTLGTNDDDYVQIILRLPPTGTQTVSFTDFAITVNNDKLSAYPTQTEAEQIDQTTTGWLSPLKYDGSEFYLPLVLTSSGTTFDTSSVGTIVAAMRSAVNNELPCDGNGYVQTAYSTLGIPYSRLGAVLFNGTNNTNLFGNGLNYANGYIEAGANQNILIYTNKPGNQTATVDGTPPTNFAIQTLFDGASTINYSGFSNSTGLVTAISSFAAPANAAASAGTSGMTVTELVPYNGTGYKYAFTVQAITSAALSTGLGVAGKYFLFSNAATNYAIWFNVNGEVAPAPAGPPTLIECKLEPNMTAVDVGLAIANCISRFEASLITAGAGITVAAGSNFSFYANAVQYTIWYQVDSSPTTAPTGLINPIKVAIASTDANTVVATATQKAINQNFIGTPNLTGVFLRGSDPTGVWNLDHATNWSPNGLIVGGSIGSSQYGQFLSHNHSFPIYQPGAFTTTVLSGTNNVTTATVTTSNTGGTETRPVNTVVNYFIKY